MRFYTNDILSKRGFDDGDMLYDLLDDNELTTLDPHRVLIKVIREQVLPKVHQKVAVFEVETIHNPIRAEAVDGVEVDNYEPNDNINLSPEFVDVDDHVILAIARELK